MLRFKLYFFLLFPTISFCQTYNEMGVNFIINDSIMIIENMDKKFKTIKIFEKECFQIREIQQTSYYQIEGDVLEKYKFYTKKSVIKIEIVCGGRNKKMILKR